MPRRTCAKAPELGREHFARFSEKRHLPETCVIKLNKAPHERVDAYQRLAWLVVISAV